MNYKCAACGWEGHKRLADKCPMCRSEVVETAYTRLPPTEPGWYWLRNYTTAGIFKDTPIAINLRKHKDNGTLVFVYGWLGEFSLSDVNGEWSERIEPPE
jgi:hypothetical protein